MSAPLDEFSPVFAIAVAAELAGMHPQTLRKYERLGLVQPGRTIGSMRVYSRDELERLRAIKRLVDDLMTSATTEGSEAEADEAPAKVVKPMAAPASKPKTALAGD